MSEKTKIPDENPAGIHPEKHSMNELRKPSTSLGPSKDEFRIVSPDIHEPAGQTTHG